LAEQQAFFDVFKTLKITDELRDIFLDVLISKISKSSAAGTYRFQIESSRIIAKENIFKMENEINRQVLYKSGYTARLAERYHLSAQYTPEKLFRIYKESLLEELKFHNMLYYSMFKDAECEFTQENVLTIKAAKSIVADAYGEEVRDLIKNIFLYRFGFDIEVQYVFEEREGYKYRDDIDKRFNLELKNISKRVNHTVEKTEQTQEESSAATLSSGTAPLQTAAVEKKPFKKEFRREFKKSDNPDVIYGRDFDDEPIPIEQIVSEMGEVAVSGQIRSCESRELRNEKILFTFDVTDFTDTISVKMFLRAEQFELLKEELAAGKFVAVKGVTVNDRFDHQLCINSVAGIRRSADKRVKRTDNAIQKRVELHCHTKMSDMDGVSDAGDIIKKAIEFGHRAVAITDHGVVQGFTEALHALQKLRDKAKKKGEELDFKIIYGVEAYLVDDLKELVVNSANQSLNDTYVVFDIETTGMSSVNDQIIEIGALKLVNGEIVDTFSEFINPQLPIPFRIEQLTGITDDMVINAPTIEVILPKFLDFIKDSVVVAHNAVFDTGFIAQKAKALGYSFDNTVVDTLELARVLVNGISKFTLDSLAKHLGVSLENHHRAIDDATCTAYIFLKLCDMLRSRGITTLDEVNNMKGDTEELVKKLPSHHAIIIATNETGRVNLYRLISNSHLKYFYRTPRIPKSDFLAHREGLIIGSACEAGELYQAVLFNRSEEEIARLVNFYDYLEIQPNGNNRFMIDSEKIPVSSEEDLWEINRKIVKLGEQFNKPVVATCDVHFLNPEDYIYRQYIMAAKGFADADRQPPLYLHTTEEMLAEFEYLGSDKAEEVVITNTNKICDMCEPIDPVSWDKCPPVIENSDNDLRNICYTRAKQIYGDELPEIVTERLERELNSIISNGYSVMYIIAQKLVWKSNDDGYLVGSRGSVGSSFAATMAGITEVNPLSPHYICTKCHYSDFDSEDVKKFAGGAGCDMPDKTCPHCGEKMKKEGFDIPFETFLGFKGNKEPDIDLNFSGEYQSKAHAYTEVIFGKGQTFKAGTIGTVADKTAYGYVAKFYEERGITKRPCEILRLSEGCVGVRRTTGQHPGGIVVLPIGHDINTFTPVQHPANDMTTNIVTTHFDYHSIDHNLLKLDILGHDDPTMIRMLQDLTGVDPKDIPLDSKEVMSLFQNTEALGIKPEDIGGCKLGALGIPEFGTDFAMQMLIDTKPQHFSDLVRIAGLSHGTDVWLGNAQTLIQEGKATISTAICTRDDIMIYLISMGLDKEQSFKIMESVRKGKGLTPEWEQMMVEHGVPDWYIWSCKKIKYMFPKAHAAAYVMMAWRIAYNKIFYPLAYYSAYFSIRAKAFSYEHMCMGRDRLEHYLAEFRKKAEDKIISNKEENMISDMRVVQEMYARGFEFVPIDLKVVKAQHFQILDGKIMPSLSAIDGIGENVAEAIVDAQKDGDFLSKDDFKARTKATQTNVEILDRLGILKGLPESNQLSLFDI
jgi:DNA polymerase-3 subunit alpha (Gram-positive type)